MGQWMDLLTHRKPPTYCIALCYIYSTVQLGTEAEKSKEKHGVWYPMPKLTITSPYVHFRVDSNTLTGQPYAKVALNPMPESTLSPSCRDFGFGLCAGYVLYM